MKKHLDPRSLAAIGLLATLLAPAALAQIPDGAFVYSSLKVLGPWPGDSGVFVAHPRDMGTLTPLTGLPESITFSQDSGSGAVGANCVLYDPDGGGVLVGTNGRAGQSLDLHRIRLRDLDVTGVERFALGTLVANGGGVFELDWLGPNEVVAAVGAIDGPAGTPATVQVARIDLTSGTVAPVDLRGFTSAGFINAIAYDGATDTLYFGLGGFASGDSEVHAMTLGGMAPPTLLATLGGALRSLAVDANGDVVAGLAVAPASGEPTLVRIDPMGATTTLLSTFDNVNTFAIEPSTGQFAVAGQPDRTSLADYGAYFFDGDPTNGGLAATLALERSDMDPAGPLSGVDVAPCPVRYGSASGAASFEWSTDPSPDRLPIAGAAWSATLDWPAGSDAWVASYVISSAPRRPVGAGFGLGLLIDPSSATSSGLLTSDPMARSSRIDADLPIALKGEALYLQAFVFGTGGLSASPGLRVAVQ